jgi:hypothetical protein
MATQSSPGDRPLRDRLEQCRLLGVQLPDMRSTPGAIPPSVPVEGTGPVVGKTLFGVQLPFAPPRPHN